MKRWPIVACLAALAGASACGSPSDPGSHGDDDPTGGSAGEGDGDKPGPVGDGDDTGNTGDGDAGGGHVGDGDAGDGGATGGTSGDGDGAGGSTNPGGEGLLCGNETCNAGDACVFDAQLTAEEVYCAPENDTGCASGCFIALCDEQGDCSSGDNCVYLLGESERLLCSPVEGYGQVCNDTVDCPVDYPVCAPLYDDPDVTEVLGWEPRICVAME